MDYRSPIIHSLKLLMAGSPSLIWQCADTHIRTGVKHGYDNVRHSNRNRRFVNHRTTHPVFQQGEITPAKTDAVEAVNRIEIRMAVVKAILVSANLSAMTAAFFL
jgi:hypothetical protein